MNDFINKKIGIWGFGVVGKSALDFFDLQQVASIEILDAQQIMIPVVKNLVTTTIQNEESIRTFLENNDIILASPGIKLHDYQQFAHKFIAELDLYQQYAPWKTIAITGSLGKTSITHLTTTILQRMKHPAIAAGNIGYPMLSLISSKNISEKECNKKYNPVVLEVSSFQLQQSATFAPELAIITNFYPNHLDHHKNIDEYFDAKCNIFIHQKESQKTLLPINLIAALEKKYTIAANWSFFSTTKPTEKELAKLSSNTIYYIHNSTIFKQKNNLVTKISDLAILPSITFDDNWLVIVAALDLQQVDLTGIATIADQLDIPDHRLQKVGTHDGSYFYNDSKSTVWQATLQAVFSLEKISGEPIKLFVGGLSKGADRTPLLQTLLDKNIEIYAFGKEADQIGLACTKFNIQHYAHATLDESWQACIKNINSPCQVLFSPGGSSFDLFADYKTRGQYFTKLVQIYCQKS